MKKYNLTIEGKKYAVEVDVNDDRRYCVDLMFAADTTCYFTLRSGGKTIITFFFDSVYIWCVCIPFARFLVHMDIVPIREMYVLVDLEIKTDSLHIV